MSYNSMFFKNQGVEYAFYLTELDGKSRMEKLDVRRFHYSNKKYATDWKNKISEKLQSEEMPNELREKAIKKLEEIYNNMIG